MSGQIAMPAWEAPMPALTCPHCAWWQYDTAARNNPRAVRPTTCPECATHHPHKPRVRLVPVWLTATPRDAP